MKHPNPVITFLPMRGSQVLMIKRSPSETNYPGLWAFPGGKVEVGETAIDCLLRELREETGLEPTGYLAFLDSYWFGSSLGFAFAVLVKPGAVVTEAGEEFRWVETIEDFRQLPRIPGIDNHYMRAMAEYRHIDSWRSAEELNLTPDRYVNN